MLCYVILANCLLIGGPLLSLSRKVAVSSLKIISLWSSTPSCCRFLCVLSPIYTIKQILDFLCDGKAYRVRVLVGFHARAVSFFIQREALTALLFAPRLFFFIQPCLSMICHNLVYDQFTTQDITQHEMLLSLSF